jgi:Phage tail protein
VTTATADDWFQLVEAGWACAVTDDAGVEWRLTDLDGWQSSGGVRTTRQNRPGRPGQFRGPAYKAERIVSLTGLAYSPDPVALTVAGNEFAALLDDGTDLATLVGYDPIGIPLQCGVELNAESKFAKASPFLANWSIQLAAPDALRYSTVLSTLDTGLQTSSGGLAFPLVFPLDFGSSFGGGSMMVVSAGKKSTLPVWTITGPVTSPSILNSDTGEYLTFSGLYVAAGQTLTIDCDARSVMLQGTAPRRGFLVEGSTFFPIRKGPNPIVFQAQDYDPSVALICAWRDAY